MLRVPLTLPTVFVRNVSPIPAYYPLRMPFPRHRPRITIVQSKHITIGIAKIDHLDIAFEDTLFDDQPFEFRELPLPTLLRKTDRDTAREQKIPAPFSNALDCLKPGFNRLLTGQGVDDGSGGFGSAGTGDQRQMTQWLRARLGDHGAGALHDGKFLAVPPECKRALFDDANGNRIGEVASHLGIRHPREHQEPRTRLVGANRKDR